VVRRVNFARVGSLICALKNAPSDGNGRVGEGFAEPDLSLRVQEKICPSHNTINTIIRVMIKAWAPENKNRNPSQLPPAEDPPLMIQFAAVPSVGLVALTQMGTCC
jgi:hypothetical protein